jgi:hypothetical protein
VCIVRVEELEERRLEQEERRLEQEEEQEQGLQCLWLQSSVWYFYCSRVLISSQPFPCVDIG